MVDPVFHGHSQMASSQDVLGQIDKGPAKSVTTIHDVCDFPGKYVFEAVLVYAFRLLVAHADSWDVWRPLI